MKLRREVLPIRVQCFGLDRGTRNWRDPAPTQRWRFVTTPRGLHGQARTADHSSKTASAPFASSLGARGIHRQIKRLGRKPGFPEGDKLEVGVKNGRWVLTNPPDRPRPAVEPVRHYFDAV